MYNDQSNNMTDNNNEVEDENISNNNHTINGNISHNSSDTDNNTLQVSLQPQHHKQASMILSDSLYASPDITPRRLSVNISSNNSSRRSSLSIINDSNTSSKSINSTKTLGDMVTSLIKAEPGMYLLTLSQ